MTKTAALDIVRKAKPTWPRTSSPLLAEYYKPTRGWRVVYWDGDERKVYAS